MTNTDAAWQHFGETDPYHGVLTKPEFEKGRFDDQAREAFFASGERYVDHVLDVAETTLGPVGPLDRALDFGCGVGRITLPLARRARAVVGVDISRGMLDEARANAQRSGLSNIEFVQSDDRLSAVTGPLSLVHTFIVMQHINPRRGGELIARFVDLLADGGVGIVHVTYAHGTSTPTLRRLVTSAYERIPMAHSARNLAKRQPIGTPQMHMHRYDLNAILTLLQEAGYHDVHVRFTEASHYNYPLYGAILFFRKRPLDTTSFS